MAHNIANDQRTNESMMFSAGALPWHKLGQNVAGAKSWQDAQKLAHLDWEVLKAPIYTQWSQSGLLKVDGFAAVVRKDTKQHLGVVGDGYELIQNRTAFDFTEALLETGALYESAGGLGNGEVIWTLARVPQADFSVGDDKHQSFLLFTTAHDGSKAATVKLTDVRVVCNNTLNMALAGNGQNLKIRHTRSADERLRAAQRMIENTVQSVKSLQEKMNLLAKRRLTKESMTTILDRLFPKPAEGSSETRRDNLIADVLQVYESNDNNTFPDQRGTAYNMLNAVTNYTDHVRGARITEGRGNMTVDQARAENAMFGTGERLKAQAFDVIYQLTDGSEEIRTETRFIPESPTELLDSIIAQ